MITKEANFQRKAHRVNVPLYIHIGDDTYHATDWSVTGVGIETEDTFVEGAELPARLMLPLKDARLHLDVQVAVRQVRDEHVGLAFVDLDPATRRILRHYMQLSIDGKLDNAEDLVALASAPTVDTPLHEAINVSEAQHALGRKFKHRGLITAVLVLVFLFLFAGTLFYNSTYRLEATGMVFGNVDRVTANYGGILQHVEAKVGTYVKKGDVLFDLLNTGANAQGLRVLNGSGSRKGTVDSADLVRTLYQSMMFARRNYRNAEQLYGERLITLKDMESTKGSYIAARVAYLGQAARLGGQYTAHGAMMGGQIVHPVIRAKHDGKVIAVSGKPGTYVGETKVVAIVQRNDRSPKVAISVADAKALKLHVDMPAEVYVPFQDRRYKAHIAAIGGATLNTAITDSMDASLNNTLVTLVFDKPSVRIPYGTRVRAWIKTF